MTDQVMLKCIYVKTFGDMFTVGKIYKASPDDFFSGQYLLTNDLGAMSQVPLEGAAWGFEIIEDEQEKFVSGTDVQEPKFGDILHINGEPFVFIRSSTEGHTWYTANTEGVIRDCDKEVFDEYAPNPYQEQRERILKRWKQRTLDNSHDEPHEFVEIRLSDLIDFVQENILAES